MKASTSAARRSASSPICAPTASRLSNEAIAAARAPDRRRITAHEYLPDEPRRTTARKPRTRRKRTRRSARPTCSAARRRSRASSTATSARLYELIWKRTVGEPDGSGGARPGRRRHRLRRRRRRACAPPARPSRSTASSSSISEDRDDPSEDEERRPPAAARRARRARRAARSRRRSISPSRRRATREASLVKKLEELGIGRPSTYASIIQVLQDRNYVRLDKKRFIPEDRGRIVTAFLDELLRALRRIRFHRRSREPARRHLRRQASTGRKVLGDFWRDFSAAVGGTKDLTITAGASTRSTRSWARISSRPHGDGERSARSARPAARAGSA